MFDTEALTEHCLGNDNKPIVVLINDKSSLNNIVRTCSKIIGVQQRDLQSIWEEWTAQKAKCIIQQSSRVLHGEFTVFPSGCLIKLLSQRQIAPHSLSQPLLSGYSAPTRVYESHEEYSLIYYFTYYSSE